MLAHSFLIESSSKLLVTRTSIKAWTSLILGQIRQLTLELLALEWRKFYTFELEYLWSQLANLDQILCVASLGVGKGCIMFWGRLDQNSGVHGNRKPPLTYNGENGVSTFSRLLLIRSLLYLQVTRTCIKSRTSSNFGQIGVLTTELAALERLKISYRHIMGKWCLHASLFIFYRIIIKVAGNQDRHQSLVKFNFGLNKTTHFGVTCSWVTNISHFRTWISLKPVGQPWSNFICSITGVGERLHKVLGADWLGTLDSGERSLPFGLLVSNKMEQKHGAVFKVRPKLEQKHTLSCTIISEQHFATANLDCKSRDLLIWIKWHLFTLLAAPFLSFLFRCLGKTLHN